MVTVHDISTSTKVVVISIRCQHIVDIIVNSFEGKTWSLLISLRCMVKYNVQNNLYSIFFQFIDQIL